MADKLQHATILINKVIAGENLTPTESERVFTDVFQYDTDGYHLAALSAAIHTKGETAEELLGFCNSTKKLGISLHPNIKSQIMTDLAGTGGGKIKTINVSTAASFIVAAAGITVGKQAVYAQTSPTGSADIFRHFGIDVFSLKSTQIEKTLEEIGICPFYLSAMSPKMKNRSIVARKVFSEKKLRIRTPFHLAALAHSPLPIQRRVYGCYDETYLEILAKLFQEMAYDHTLVVHGRGGLPEVSNFGTTVIVEQKGSSVKKLTLHPKDFGVRTANIAKIRSGGKAQNIKDFSKVLHGKWDHPKTDLVAINAGTSLYVMGKAESFKKGTKLAQELLKSGKAYQKFTALIQRLGNKTA